MPPDRCSAIIATIYAKKRPPDGNACIRTLEVPVQHVGLVDIRQSSQHLQRVVRHHLLRKRAVAVQK